MTQENLGQDLGRLFEVGFNIGLLTYIKQNNLNQKFGDLYNQDLQKLNFNKILRRLADKEKVVSEQHRQIVAKWSIFFIQKGFLAGLNFFNEYIKSLNYNQNQIKRLEIVYFQCCFSNQNSIGTHPKPTHQLFQELLSQFNISHINFTKYSQKGEFLNADTLILLRYGKQVRILCVDLSVFSIKSIRDLVDVNNIEVLKKVLLSEISYLKSKSVFSNLGLDTKSSGIKFSSNLAIYLTAFKRQDKESIKLIQAASYTYSFYSFLSSNNLIKNEDHIKFNIVGYSDRGMSALSVNLDSIDILATCSQIYKHDSSEDEIQEARKKVIKLIKLNASRSFQKGSDFIKKLIEVSEDGINQVIHQEQIDGFFNSVDTIPEDLAKKLKITQNSTLRDAHKELIINALTSDATYVFLTGNPGIGKTTAIAEFLQSENCLNEGFLFFYVSPRNQVNLDIIEKFTDEQNKFSHDKIFAINTNDEIIKSNSGKCTVNYLSNIYTDNFEKQTVSFINQSNQSKYTKPYQSNLGRITEDKIQARNDNKKGVLYSISQAVYTIIKNSISSHIIATVSIQSLKKTNDGKDTLHHFERIFQDAYNTTEGSVIPSQMKLISSKIKHLFIMIDEITGDDSGVEFLNGISRILNDYGFTNNKYGFNIKVIIADASIVDPDVIQQHLSDNSPEPNKIFFRKSISDCLPLSTNKIIFNKLESIIINANSYPAKSLSITYKIFIDSIRFNNSYLIKANKNLQSYVHNKIVEDINLLLKQPSNGQIIVYIQDKIRLANLIDKIQENHKDFEYQKHYLEIHSNLSDRDKQDINLYKNSVNVIFMTASASRGLSFPKAKHILVEIPRFEIEKNLMEIIQVIYRGRGDAKLDNENKELIFYLHEQAIYYQNDKEQSLQESKLNILNILLILKTSIMTRISGSWPIGRDKFSIIPIGGKSVFAAGQSFSSKMEILIKQLQREHKRRRNDNLLEEVYVSLKHLLSQVNIVIKSDLVLKKTQDFSYLSLRESLNDKFLKLINNSFEQLLNFPILESSYISGSLLIVPIKDKILEENYKIKISQEIINYDNGELLNKMQEIVSNLAYPRNLRSGIEEAINLVNLLWQEKSYKTQILEQHSQYFDQYYALPLFTFISSEAFSQYFSSNCEEAEDQRFRDILATYIQLMYPVANIIPIGHKYKDFPFVVFRSYSLNQIRTKIFTDKYLLTSSELNVINLILSEEN